MLSIPGLFIWDSPLPTQSFTCHCKHLVINVSRFPFILLMSISSLGSLEHLLTYETKRQQSVVPMITAIDALKRLYSTSSTLPVLARSFGLIATSALPPIKVMFFLIKVL